MRLVLSGVPEAGPWGSEPERRGICQGPHGSAVLGACLENFATLGHRHRPCNHHIPMIAEHVGVYEKKGPLI